MLLDTPILVPHPDWKKSADALKWLKEEDFLTQLELVVGALIILSQETPKSVHPECVHLHANVKMRELSAQVDTEFRFRKQLFKDYNPQILDMWRGHEWHLAMYGMYLSRSFSKHAKEHEVWHAADVTWVSKACQQFYLRAQKTRLPYWFGTEFVHNSHQCWLVRYDSHYKHQFNAQVAKSASLLPVVWPPYEKAKVVPVMGIKSSNIK